jgi:hypothetical protein
MRQPSQVVADRVGLITVLRYFHLAKRLSEIWSADVGWTAASELIVQRPVGQRWVGTRHRSSKRLDTVVEIKPRGAVSTHWRFVGHVRGHADVEAARRQGKYQEGRV